MLNMKIRWLFQLISKMNSSLDTQSRFDQFLNVVVMISISTITTQVEIDAENTKYMYGLRSKELSFEFLLFGYTISYSFPCQSTSSFSPLTAHEKNSFVKHSLFRPELDQITCSQRVITTSKLQHKKVHSFLPMYILL
jgi:hypothetical protein